MEVVSEIRATIIEPIGEGEGRNSRVYLAHDPQVDGLVALKEVDSSCFKDIDEYFREAQILHKNSHPCVVPVRYAATDGSWVRLVMPYFEKGSLNPLIESRTLTPRRIVAIGTQILRGLHHIHSNNIVHFDIKPTNILLHNDGTAMVADFGQSRSTNELGVADVPPMYLAHVPPECLFRDKVTKQADIFQVGLTLYRLANSNYIFNKQLAAWDLKGLQERIIKGTFPDRAHFLPHVPKRLRTIIRKALRPDPRTRYQTPLEMVDALGRVEELLDWECELDDWSCRWIKRGKTHDYRLELATDGKRWRTQGSTERRSDGYTQARNTWNLGPYNTYKQAMRDIADLFGEMEEDEKG